MKGLTAIALLFALGTAAAAKPTPVEHGPNAVMFDDADINVGGPRALREREYFQAPQTQFNAGSFICRVPLIVFDKTRLASLCH